MSAKSADEAEAQKSDDEVTGPILDAAYTVADAGEGEDGRADPRDTEDEEAARGGSSPGSSQSRPRFRNTKRQSICSSSGLFVPPCAFLSSPSPSFWIGSGMHQTKGSQPMAVAACPGWIASRP